MNSGNVQALAREGSLEDLVNLLNRFGKSKFYADQGYGSLVGYGINYIVDGIKECEDEALRAEKLSLVADYEGKRGVFAKWKPLQRKKELEACRALDRDLAARKKESALKEDFAAQSAPKPAETMSPEELNEILEFLADSIVQLTERMDRIEGKSPSKNDNNVPLDKLSRRGLDPKF